MIKHALTSAITLLALGSTAFAGQWNVTETASSGIRRSSGTWTLATEGDKVTGKGDMQLDNGTVLTYKLEGVVAGGVYSLKFADRTDGKKNCVWTGKPVESASAGGRVINGEVACDGEKFLAKAGVN